MVDAYALPVSTDAPEALAAYARAAHGLLGWDGRDWPAAQRQLALLRERAPKDRTGLVGAGDYRRAVDVLEPLRGRFIELGGSRAQRDVFADTLLEACFRAGDVERAERLLAERVARRPDHYWLTRPSRGRFA